MRRQEKQLSSRSEIDTIIAATEVLRLAMALDNEPYLVPLNFGYDGEAFYFHTATAGRKIVFFTANPRVCFECEGPGELVTDEELACRWTMHFSSVIGYGTIHELVGEKEKCFGLNQIMRHYSGRDWEFSEPRLEQTRVWRLAIETINGKRSPAGAPK